MSHVAAENCAGHKAYFDARVIPGVAYTAPEVAWVGETELSAKASGRKITKPNFPWAASGRAIANGCDSGFTKLIFDAETGRIIGGGIVGPNGGDMIGEVCLAIEMGCDAADIGKTIHPHPTLANPSVWLRKWHWAYVPTCRPRKRNKFAQIKFERT